MKSILILEQKEMERGEARLPDTGFVSAFFNGEKHFLSIPKVQDKERIRSISLKIKTPHFLRLINLPDCYLEPQEEGGYVAHSQKYSGAIGQGETIEEALKDLEEAIELLREVLEEDASKR